MMVLVKFLFAVFPFVSSAVKTIRADATRATLAAATECQGSVIAGADACGGGAVPDCNNKYVKLGSSFAQCKQIHGNCLTSAMCIEDADPNMNAFILAPVGANACPPGTGSITQKESCAAATAVIHKLYGKSVGRGMQVGSGGKCNDMSWGWVPLGCSVQSGFWKGGPGDWAAHFKTSGSNCPHKSLYQLVCKNVDYLGKDLILAPLGATECPSGTSTPVDKTSCTEAGQFIQKMYGKSPSRGVQVGSGGKCNDMSWGWVPLGCSVQSGFWKGGPGDWAAVFKTSGSNCPHKSLYQLICVAA